MVLMLLGLLVLPISSIGLMKVEQPQVAGTKTYRINENVKNRAKLLNEAAAKAIVESSQTTSGKR